MRYFRRRSISPATRQRRAARIRGRQALVIFPGRLLAWNYRQKRRSRVNSRPNKHPRSPRSTQQRLLHGTKAGEGKEETEGGQDENYEKDNNSESKGWK
eukprot:543611-Heterocapsa_arctica.AAC.1